MSEPTLSEFQVDAAPWGDLFGAYLATHAMPDGFFLMHTGVGCKLKAQGHIEPHDWAQESHTRQCHTEISDLDLITDTVRRIRPYARSWSERRSSGVVVLVSSTVAEMTGEDFASAAKNTEEQLGIPVLYVPTPGYQGDLWSGYGKVMAAVANRWTENWKKEKSPDEPHLGLWGYLFDRHEADCIADVSELKQMVQSALGIDSVSVGFCGDPFDKMIAAPTPSLIGNMPYGQASKAVFSEKAADIPLVDLPYPIGPAATRLWLSRLANSLSIPEKQIESWQYSNFGNLESWAYFRRHLGHSIGAVVAAEAPLAASLVSALAELDLETAVVFTLDRSQGGAKRFKKDLAAISEIGELTIPTPEVVECPSQETFARTLDETMKGRWMSVLLAPTTLTNSTDRNVFACVEVGFPRYRYHAWSPSPLFGVNGFQNLGQRISNAITRLS